MHEATRKLLGVLLREMDGFDRTKRSVVIGATNRKADLDPALLSRFDTVVDFPLPDNRCRCLAVGSAWHCLMNVWHIAFVLGLHSPCPIMVPIMLTERSHTWPRMLLPCSLHTFWAVSLNGCAQQLLKLLNS